MSIPLIAVAVAGGALLLTGAKEKKAGAPSNASSGASATPTTQTTGGDMGAPSAPSHAGSEATNTVNDIPITPAETTAVMTAPVATSQAVPDQPIADPWATPPGPSVSPTVKSSADALVAVGTIGALTGKAAAQSFQVLGESLGAIW